MKLSICMITYNHASFIADALEGILNQQFLDEMEVVIGEDGSSDDTRKICHQYAQKYPTLIRLMPAAPNKGMMANFIETLKSCTGKYIAFIEGDDVWTDIHKLQKQVQFLDENPEYSLTFHNVLKRFVTSDGDVDRVFHEHLEQSSFTTEDLLTQWFIPSSAVVFRNFGITELPDWFRHCKSGDIPFLLLQSLHGPFRYIPEVMGVYRIHEGEVSKTHQGYDKIVSMVYIYENFNIHTQYRFKTKVRDAIIYEINRHLPGDILPPAPAKEKKRDFTFIPRFLTRS